MEELDNERQKISKGDMMIKKAYTKAMNRRIKPTDIMWLLTHPFQAIRYAHFGMMISALKQLEDTKR